MPTKNNKLIIAFVGTVFVLAVLLAFLQLGRPASKLGEGAPINPTLSPTLSFSGVVFNIEIADTQEKRRQGLSGREGLDNNEGMLFIFDQPGIYGFWMKDMNFPIDIVWLDENLTVIGISEKLPPESYPQTFYPPSKTTYVLEINAEEAEKNRISSGSKAILTR